MDLKRTLFFSLRLEVKAFAGTFRERKGGRKMKSVPVKRDSFKSRSNGIKGNAGGLDVCVLGPESQVWAFQKMWHLFFPESVDYSALGGSIFPFIIL